MTWLRKLWTRAPAPPGQDAKMELHSCGGAGVQVAAIASDVVVGLTPHGTGKRFVCVLSPECARSLAFELWEKARRAGRCKVH